MFAAYAQKKEGESDDVVLALPSTSESGASSWLQNSSFAVNLVKPPVKESVARPASPPESPSSEESSNGDDDSSKRKKKKKRKKRAKEKSGKKSKKKKKDDDAKGKGKDSSTKPMEGLGPPMIPNGTVFSNRLPLKLDRYQAFYEDKKGDRSNLGFNRLYNKHVARYCYTSQQLEKVSLLNSFLIFFNFYDRHYCANRTLDGKLLPSRPPNKPAPKKPKPVRYFGKRATARLSKSAQPVIVEKPTPKETPRNPLGIYDASTVLYVQGRRAAEEQQSAPTVETDEELTKRETTLFNEKLRQNPHDIQLWLSFIQFQDKIRFSGSEESLPKEKKHHKVDGKILFSDLRIKVTSPSLLQNYQKALMERKISILDKALEHNPKSEKLLTAKLRTGAEFREAAALQQEWRNALFIRPESIRLWKDYLHFCQSYFEGFTVQQVLKAYAGCLHKLAQMQHPSFAAHQRPANLEDQMVDIVAQLCIFLRQSGWTEKSVSLNQALLQIGLKGSSLAVCQSVWENRTARIGEEEVNGFRLVYGNDCKF